MVIVFMGFLVGVGVFVLLVLVSLVEFGFLVKGIDFWKNNIEECLRG